MEETFGQVALQTCATLEVLQTKLTEKQHGQLSQFLNGKDRAKLTRSDALSELPRWFKNMVQLRLYSMMRGHLMKPVLRAHCFDFCVLDCNLPAI